MHRVLRDHGLGGRRRQRRPVGRHSRPRLVTTAPNMVWVWDISRLPGPGKGVWFSLYAVWDLWSRKTVGWCVGIVETAEIRDRRDRRDRRTVDDRHHQARTPRPAPADHPFRLQRTHDCRDDHRPVRHAQDPPLALTPTSVERQPHAAAAPPTRPSVDQPDRTTRPITPKPNQQKRQTPVDTFWLAVGRDPLGRRDVGAPKVGVVCWHRFDPRWTRWLESESGGLGVGDDRDAMRECGNSVHRCVEHPQRHGPVSGPVVLDQLE